MELIKPGTLEFRLVLEDLPPPPGWQQEAARTNGRIAIICEPGEFSLPKLVEIPEWQEFVMDGAAEKKEAELEEQSILWLPG